jgi:hypothetical protein
MQQRYAVGNFILVIIICQTVNCLNASSQCSNIAENSCAFSILNLHIYGSTVKDFWKVVNYCSFGHVIKAPGSPNVYDSYSALLSSSIFLLQLTAHLLAR